MLPSCRKRPIGIGEHRVWYAHLLVDYHGPRFRLQLTWLLLRVCVGLLGVLVLVVLSAVLEWALGPTFAIY